MAALPTARIERPTIGRPRIPEIISFTQFPFASQTQVIDALANDSYTRYPDVHANYAYFLLGGYVTLNPGGETTTASNLLGLLALEDIEELRRTGLLLYNQRTGEYFLMQSYAGNRINPSLVDRFQGRLIARNEDIATAASLNGLVNGVTEGDITNIDDYLVESGFQTEKDIFSIREATSEIYAYNLLMLQTALAGIPDESSGEFLSQNLLRTLYLLFTESDVTPTHIANIVRSCYPEPEGRLKIFSRLTNELYDAQAIQMLEVMEMLGDFKWNDFDITQSKKLEAIVPNLDAGDQVTTRQILEKHVARLIIEFIDNNPSFAKRYIAIVKYVTDRLTFEMLMANIEDYPDKIRAIDIALKESLERSLRVRLGRR